MERFLSGDRRLRRAGGGPLPPEQLLDVVLIRRGTNPIPRPLPDGFDDLAPHNLLTFKSHQEALDGWTLAELIGHSVNYRKQNGPSQQEILPESEVRLYAVCVRFPRNLANAGILHPVCKGVYDVIFPTVAAIRVIVVNRLPREVQNAILHLFSTNIEAIRYGKEHYGPRSLETSTLLLNLFRAYREDLAMSTELKEFVRQSIDELLSELPPEELRKHLSAEERLKGLQPEERLKGLTPEERLAGMSQEELRRVLDTLQRRLGKNGSSPDQN